MALIGTTTGVLALEALTALDGFTLIGNMTTMTARDMDQWALNLQATASLYILAIIPAAIAFLCWLSRAVENIPALGGGQPSVSPRGAIGWWFVPIANLAKPYTIVADLWKRMALSPSEQGTYLVAAWWILWIGGEIVARVINAMPGPETIDDFQASLGVATLALVAQIVAGGLLIRIIWETEHRIRIRAAQKEPEHAAEPPAPVIPIPTPSAAPTMPIASGERLRSISFCPRCGVSRRVGERFCVGCGTDLNILELQA